jgi:hypothetical protein
MAAPPVPTTPAMVRLVTQARFICVISVRERPPCWQPLKRNAIQGAAAEHPRDVEDIDKIDRRTRGDPSVIRQVATDGEAT